MFGGILACQPPPTPRLGTEGDRPRSGGTSESSVHRKLWRERRLLSLVASVGDLIPRFRPGGGPTQRQSSGDTAQALAPALPPRVDFSRPTFLAWVPGKGTLESWSGFRTQYGATEATSSSPCPGPGRLSALLGYRGGEGARVPLLPRARRPRSPSPGGDS